MSDLLPDGNNTQSESKRTLCPLTPLMDEATIPVRATPPPIGVLDFTTKIQQSRLAPVQALQWYNNSRDLHHSQI